MAILFEALNVHAQGTQFLFYFPQSLDSQNPEHVIWDTPAEEGSLHVPVPQDRVNDDLWIWQFGDEVLETGQTASRRIGFCRFDDVSRMSAGSILDCTFHHQDGLKTGVMQLRIQETPYPYNRNAVREDFQRHYTEEDHKVVQSMIATDSAFFHTHPQHIPNVEAWFTGAKQFPVGPLPLWSFVLEYSSPRFPAHIATGFLNRLFEIAMHRLGHDALATDTHAEVKGSPDDLVNLQAEVMGEMATLLAVISVYRFDTRPCRTRDGEDQWVHPLIMPSLERAGFDCEDSASIIFLVLRLLQTTELDSSAHPFLRQVQQLAQRYMFFFTIGTLKIPNSEDPVNGAPSYTYHAFVIGVDGQNARYLLTQSQLLRRGSRMKARKPHATPVPPLAFEGTEYTTSNLRFSEYPHTPLFRRNRLRDNRSHAKIPSELLREAHQYRYVVELVAPHLYTETGACQFAVVDKNDGQTVGVPFQDFIDLNVRIQPLQSISPAQYRAVENAVLQFPRTLLPIPPSDAAAAQLPPFDRDTVLLTGVRAIDMDEVFESDTAHTAGKAGLTFHATKVTLFHGLPYTYLHVSEKH